MRLTAVCTGLILLTLFVPRAEALRCGSDLVREGDPAYQVQRACGEPDWVRSWHPDYGVRDEIWHYNFGPYELIRVMHFRDGRLRRIEAAGRGFRESNEPGSCRPLEVEKGMSARELLQRCGEPVQRETGRMEYPAAPHRKQHHRFRSVFVENWYYEFGSRHLPRKVRLMDGIVADIETAN